MGDRGVELKGMDPCFGEFLLKTPRIPGAEGRARRQQQGVPLRPTRLRATTAPSGTSDNGTAFVGPAGRPEGGLRASVTLPRDS